MIVWTPKRQEEYTVELEGQKLGIGLHPALVDNPGAWNLLWLSSRKMDDLENWQGLPQEYPCGFSTVAVAVGASWQVIDNCVVGDFAATMEPLEFLRWLAYHKEDRFIIPALLGQAWWGLAELKARGWKGGPKAVLPPTSSAPGSKVLVGNFGRR